MKAPDSFIGALKGSRTLAPRLASLTVLGTVLVFFTCTCPAAGLVPSSGLALRPWQHQAYGMTGRAAHRRSGLVAWVSPEDTDRELEEAGLHWRAVAAKQDPEELLDYVGWLRADRQALRSALAAQSGDGRAALPSFRGHQAAGGGAAGPKRFDLALAVEMAGFAFETYNQPEGGRWEEGADGVKVAFTSDAFAAACYRGLLTVRLREADQLPRESLVEALAAGFTGGSGFNPFVMFALVEGRSDDALASGGLPASGVRGLARAFDVAQSSTSRARDYETGGGFGGLGKETFSRAFWGPSQEANGAAADGPKSSQKGPAAAGKGSSSPGKDGQDARLTGSGETFYLYVKDPSTARLVVSVEEDSVLKSFGKAKGVAGRKQQDEAAAAKVVVGSASKGLTELLEGCDQPPDQGAASSSGSKAAAAGAALNAKLAAATTWPGWPLARWPVAWEGWLPLTHAPAEDKTGKAAGAALAGAMVGGPVGAMAAGGAALLWNKQVKGRVRFDLSYQPLALGVPSLGGGSSSSGSSSSSSGLLSSPTTAAGAGGLAAGQEAAARRPPKGGTPGLDWGDLSAGLGVADSAASLEFCAFVDSGETDTQAALWRDTDAKRIVVAFRGTSSPGDLVVDAKILQTPWRKKGPDDKAKDGEPMVHAGFREASDSIARRLKELLLAAVEGDLAGWEVLVTGHSLGGALATLFTTDLAVHGCDAGRGLPTEAPSKPWWGRLLETPQAAQDRKPPRPARLICYTFGCPRVGNRAFADLLSKTNAPNLELYRVVSGADVVARLPRHGNAVNQLLDYEHSGPTVLVSDQDCTAGGASRGGDECDVSDASLGALWVEGETDAQPCPLRDTSPLVDPLADGALLFEALRAGVQQGSVQAALAKLTAVSPSELSQLVGLDGRFLAAELELVDSLRRGDAIVHHLEPSYFKALANAAAASGLWDNAAAGGKPPPTDVAAAVAAAGGAPATATAAAGVGGSNAERLRAAGITARKE